MIVHCELIKGNSSLKGQKPLLLKENPCSGYLTTGLSDSEELDPATSKVIHAANDFDFFLIFQIF